MAEFFRMATIIVLAMWAGVILKDLLDWKWK